MKNDRQLPLSVRFILASIALHFIFMLTLQLTPSTFFAPVTFETVELDLIDANPADPTQAMPAMQIVEQQERDFKEEENKTAKFLSVQNQSVLKETVAEKKGEFKNAQKSGSKGTGRKQDLKTVLIKDLTRQYDPQGLFEKIERKKLSQQQGGSGSPGEASQTSDYLKGKDLGLETLLNTREYKYYTYFNRIRRKLSEHWEPQVKQRMSKMFKQGRTIASTQDRITKLLIILNDAGVLMKVQVISDSGIHDLDEAAMDAFRAAAPFPHPPKGIVDHEGMIKIRWDFILES